MQYVSNALAKSSGVVRTSLAHLLEAGGSRQPGSHTHLDSLLATDAQVGEKCAHVWGLPMQI